MSCAATINGQMTLFGGPFMSSYVNQIAVVASCGLTRLGDLPMNFTDGACNTFTTSTGIEEALLCFGQDREPGESSCHR